MPMTTAGKVFAVQAIHGEAVTPFNSANTYLGVGDSNTSFDAAQTDLQASTNKVRKLVEAGYPQRSGLTVNLRAIFSSEQANFAWNEIGVFNASSGGTMLSRLVQALGTKTSASSWQLDLELEYS